MRHSARVMRMEQVAGGVEDIVRIDYVVLAPELADERRVIEFCNGSLDHYFITAEPAEAAMLVAGLIRPAREALIKYTERVDTNSGRCLVLLTRAQDVLSRVGE